MDFLEFIARNPSVIGGVVLLFIGFWAYRQTKRDIARSKTLNNTLTEMHERLLALQKQKTSHTTVNSNKLEQVLPTLLETMGLMQQKEYPKFKDKVRRRVQQRISKPLQSIRRLSRFQEFVRKREVVQDAALSVGSEIIKELLDSKNWSFEDVVKIAEWIDRWEWGVKLLRDQDKGWNKLYKSVKPYLRDAELRAFIQEHINLSYAYNNFNLMIQYTASHPKGSFGETLHEWLIGSTISPIQMEDELNKILEKIEERLEALEEKQKRKTPNE